MNIKEATHVCPACKTEHNAIGTMSGRSNPVPNDLSICCECGQYMRFNHDMSLRSTSEEELLAEGFSRQALDRARAEFAEMKKHLSGKQQRSAANEIIEIVKSEFVNIEQALKENRDFAIKKTVIAFFYEDGKVIRSIKLEMDEGDFVSEILVGTATEIILSGRNHEYNGIIQIASSRFITEPVDKPYTPEELAKRAEEVNVETDPNVKSGVMAMIRRAHCATDMVLAEIDKEKGEIKIVESTADKPGEEKKIYTNMGGEVREI